jgi:hypothetical protein
MNSHLSCLHLKEREAQEAWQLLPSCVSQILSYALHISAAAVGLCASNLSAEASPQAVELHAQPQRYVLC